MASYGELVKHRAGTQTNTIDEYTAASGVRVDGVLLKDAGVTASGGVSTNTITEFTSGSGVTVDGLLIKDTGIEAAVKVQFTQQASDPTTPSSGKSEFYVKTDGKSYLKNSDGVVTPVGGGNTIDRVAQNSHGFAVGNLVRITGNDTYTGANATGATEAEVAGMIYRVIGANEFEVTTGGVVDGVPASGFVGGSIPAAGTMCFLNAATGTGAGLLTITEPSVVGYISKPCYLVSASGSTASGYFFNMRGSTVGGANLYTSITLANNATTTIQNVSGFAAGTGGTLKGYIKIAATTNAVLTFEAQFTKPITGTGYNVSATFGAGDVPTGLVIGITTGGDIQVTLPSVTGFSSSSATFAINAAAVGATLPLQIDSNKITWDVTALANSDATQLGLKQYLHGTTYNGGNAPTVSCAQAGTSVTRGVFVPYKAQDGAWRLRFNVVISFNSATMGGITVSVNGITTKNTNNFYQSICGFFIGNPSTIIAMYANINTNTFELLQTSAITVSGVSMSGDIELNSKPTWAY